MTKISLDALQVIDAIDRKGSFAAAAEDLHRVPSAVTYSVRQLEGALGVELFDRRGHRAVLTHAGAELLSQGRQLLRAAAEVECRVQQVARGWESELRIAVDTVIGMDRMLRLVGEFYEQKSGTQLRLMHEVLAGVWDALASGRADLAIGASGDAPAGRSYATRVLGRMELVFVAAPFHEIVKEPRPLTDATIQKYRAVSIADSTRVLAPRTLNLLAGQDVLTVSSMNQKAAAHIAGLGVGFLPRPVAEREAQAGRLVILPVAAGERSGDVAVAWRPGEEGNALKWFVKRLEDPLVAAELLS
jgi:DNA-binding transcriptional LysR family regulator